MPINFLGSVVTEGTSAIPYYSQLKRYGPYVVSVLAIKRYFGGSFNTWERDMHGRVVLITGGTSGVGAVMARELATRGAQVILLVRSLSDEWTVTYIKSLREETGNALIYGEQVDLGDLLSIRKFATQWLNNSPPRRLDMIICCAGVSLPPSRPRRITSDGLEEQLQVNFLGHYHLIDLLQPSLRYQPPDRDVRVIFTSCVSSVMGDLKLDDLEFLSRGYPVYQPWKVHGAAKLALTMSAYQLEKQITSKERGDKMPHNIRVAVVDPGMMRSPSFKRFISFGSVLGLFIYLLLWPFWWLFLKTSIQGAESLLFASMCPDIVPGEVHYVSECRIRPRPPRKELKDEELQQKLCETVKGIIQDTEKKSAKRNKLDEKAKAKAEEEAKTKKTKNSKKKSS